METYTCDTKYEGPPPPKGYRIKCVRVPKNGEVKLQNGEAHTCACDHWAIYPILERIEPVRLTMWANIYEIAGAREGCLHCTPEKAGVAATRDAIAVAVPATIEYYPDK